MPPTHVFLAKRVHHRNEADPLLRAMQALGWKETTNPAAAAVIWDVETLADTVSSTEPLPGQIVNRLPAMLHCCRKAVFARLTSRLRALLPADSPLDDGRYIPSQWSLPLQSAALAAIVPERAAHAKRHGRPAPIYIVKPDGGSQGDGILLTPDPCRSTWDASRERVVQEYVGTPMLLDGLKFDLRLYVLVTSIAPLRAFLCHEGLARFAVDEYVEPSRENLRNVHMHLTNYSLNKKAEGFKASDEADGGDDGSKRTVSSVFAALKAAGRVADTDALWAEIGALVARTLAAVQPALASARGAQPCFQVLGFDILLDSEARPWLLELNDHPSLRIDLSYDEPGQYSMNGLNSVPSPVDEAIKVPMLEDALRVVGGLLSLPTKPRQAADAGGAFGTSFHEVATDSAELEGFRLVHRLTSLFERHTPASVRREESDAKSVAHYGRDPDKVPGPRWRGSAAFAAFLQSAGLVGRGPTPRAGALGRHDVDLVVLAICGKGGTMDVVDFCEACALAARRLWPERREERASDLLAALLDGYYPAGAGEAGTGAGD